MARDDEAARYREAARLTLDQLDWCIEYFRTIRKPGISSALARNRAAIGRVIEGGNDGSSQRSAGPPSPT